ncbi:ribonuclease P protein component [Treponema pedis]|uniref:ribonuclease P protein component n=1 Tax=Treponema pedis TaxID=409322 RepID=UPI000494AF90|nr:ribonuclease P protein component [Treponema pedis]
MDNFTFPREERLRSKAAIKHVFSKGVKITCRGAALFIVPNGLEYNRFLCTFKRGFGTAVERNKARRISKEAYRKIKPQLKTGKDFVLLAFSSKDGYFERFNQLVYLFTKAEMYKM